MFLESKKKTRLNSVVYFQFHYSVRRFRNDYKSSDICNRKKNPIVHLEVIKHENISYYINYEIWEKIFKLLK